MVADVEQNAVVVEQRETLPGRLVLPATAPSGGLDASGRTAALQALRNFYRTGRTDTPQTPATLRLLPVPLYAFRDLTRFRGDYPVCLLEGAAAPEVRSLTALMDDLAEGVADDGEAGAEVRHHLLRLEAALRKEVAENGEGRLSVLWDRAAEKVLAGTGRPEKKEALGLHLRKARAALPGDGPVLTCAPDTPARLLRAAHEALSREQGEALRETTMTLAARLRDVLEVDFSKTDAAHGPDALKASVGRAYRDELDFDVLAHLLDDTPKGEPLPAARKARLQEVLDKLQTLTAALFEDEPPVTKTCAGAEERMAEVRQNYIGLLRARHIAWLELENQYREARHDVFFERYGWSDLTPEERTGCPVVVVYLDGATLESERCRLEALLDTGLPVKVLVSLGDLIGSAGATPDARASLGLATAVKGGRYVLQTSAASVEPLAAGFASGLHFEGAALFCVYTAADAVMPALHPYLRAAIVLDARALPAFTYDPAAGSDWAARFSLIVNPQPERLWPISEVAYEQSEGASGSLSLPYTYADLLASDHRFDAHFMDVPAARWMEEMMPLADFLEQPVEARMDAIPYLWMVNETGTLHRVVVTDTVVRAAQRVASQWRIIQEFGGIDNSYVRRLLAEERTRMAEEARREVEAVKQHYEEAMAQATGTLAREIVENIAAGMLNQAPAGSGTPPRPMAPVKPAVAAPAEAAAPPPKADAAPAEEPVVEEEEEALSMDEAYIETPRCTSCNECTVLNPLIFAYNNEKQAYIKDASAGPYRDIVAAAEKCPVRIIHPGKPLNPDESDLEALMKRAEPFL